MHICRISKGFLPRRDGWSAHAYYLSLHQAYLGHSIVVLQPFWSDEQQGRLTIQQLRVGLFAHHLDWKLSTVAICLRALPPLFAFHRRRRFDVLHLHGDVIEVAVLAPWARELGIPLVLSVHGGLNRKAIYRRIAKPTFALIDGFIGTSEAVRRDLLSMGIEPSRVTVISSGVDTDLFTPPAPGARREARRCLGIGEDDKVVISVGRLHPMKGYSELIAAAARLRLQSSLKFLIVGDGPEREALQRQSVDLPAVRFIRGVHHEEVPRYLYAADIFVLPSIDLPGTTETTPTALLEAMACGLPVVCTDSGGMPDIVGNGKNGYVVPQGEPDALADAISALITDENSRRNFGDHNVALARKRAWPIIAREVTSFYERFTVIT